MGICNRGADVSVTLIFLLFVLDENVVDLAWWINIWICVGAFNDINSLIITFSCLKYSYYNTVILKQYLNEV